MLTYCRQRPRKIDVCQWLEEGSGTATICRHSFCCWRAS